MIGSIWFFHQFKITIICFRFVCFEKSMSSFWRIYDTVLTSSSLSSKISAFHCNNLGSASLWYLGKVSWIILVSFEASLHLLMVSSCEVSPWNISRVSISSNRSSGKCCWTDSFKAVSCSNCFSTLFADSLSSLRVFDLSSPLVEIANSLSGNNVTIFSAFQWWNGPVWTRALSRRLPKSSSSVITFYKTSHFSCLSIRNCLLLLSEYLS